MKSLLYHSVLRQKVEDPALDPASKSLLRETLRRKYQPVKWKIPSDFLSFEHFRRVVSDMDMTATPGYPYQLAYPTNGAYLGYRGDGTFDENILRQHYNSVVERIRLRECDPIRLFIKQEPHKKSKADKQSWRLISAVSVLDQIIDHMLFDPMNQKMVDEHLHIVPQVGWAPLYQGWTMMPTTGIAMDKSGWDWSVLPWLIDEVLELRATLCENMTDEWRELARWRYSCLFNQPVFVTSSGHFFRQRNPGVMKSGCVNTITDNSIMQDVLDIVVAMETGLWSLWMKTMGDDTLQSDPGDIRSYVKTLSKYCLVKDVVNRVQFAGFDFSYDHVEPLYFGKHCWNLLHANPAHGDELASSYSLLYHRSRKNRLIKRVVAYLGYVPSDDWLDQIWDGEEV